MSEPMETTFMQEDFIKITNQKVIIGTITYPTAGIKSVRLTTQPRSYRSLWLSLAGVPLTMWAIVDETRQFAPFLNVGIALIVIGLVLVVLSKPAYGVQVTGAEGERVILKTTRLGLTQRTVDALKNAIANKEKSHL